MAIKFMCTEWLLGQRRNIVPQDLSTSIDPKMNMICCDLAFSGPISHYNPFSFLVGLSKEYHRDHPDLKDVKNAHEEVMTACKQINESTRNLVSH